MTTYTIPKSLAILGAALLLTAASTQAADITWGSALNITGNATDVSTNGDLVYAINFGGSQSGASINATINGVTFVGASTAGISNVFSTNAGNWNRTGSGRDNAPFSNMPADSQTLLQSYIGAAATTGAVSTFTITLEGLTIGSHYELQLWANNSAWKSAGLYYGMDVSAGNSVVLKTNVNETTGGLGQYVTGTFTADGTTQTITFTTDMDNSLALVNALQLREIQQIPEASTYALIVTGCALAAIALRRRARR